MVRHWAESPKLCPKSPDRKVERTGLVKMNILLKKAMSKNYPLSQERGKMEGSLMDNLSFKKKNPANILSVM